MRIVMKDSVIANLPFAIGNGNKLVYHDIKQPALKLFVSEHSRSWYFQKRHRRQSYKIFLGRYPDLTIENARIAAADCAGLLARGVDPRSSKTLTVAELWERYAAVKSGEQKAFDNTLDYYIRHVAPRWQNYVIDAVTRAQVNDWVYKIGAKSGKATANRAVSVLSAMFSFAIKRGLIADNPCRGVDRFQLKSRVRFLAPGDEIEAFKRALVDATPDMQDFILLALNTGARKSNLLQMSWKELDLVEETWTIPGEKSKNGQMMVLPLNKAAMEILQRRHAARKSAWVFPSRRSSCGHMSSPYKSFQRLCRKHGIEDLRIHDLRRTFGSHLAINGVSLLIIGSLLGHKDWRSTLIYSQLTHEAQRAALKQIAI